MKTNMKKLRPLENPIILQHKACGGIGGGW